MRYRLPKTFVPLRRLYTPLVVAAVPLMLGPLGGRGAAAIREPPPPVTVADFRLEPPGAVPRDGDGRIPNRLTPAGGPLTALPPCDVSFVAGAHVTAETVNRAIAAVENRLRAPYTVCLAGTFTGPIHVWGKYDPALLTIEPIPGRTATIMPGAATASAVDPAEFDGVAAAVSIVGSRGVAVRSLTITGYHTTGTAATPAGILVEEAGSGYGVPVSPCFTQGDGACSDIYLEDNRTTGIANKADAVATSRRWCNNPNVDAFGIEVEAYGRGPRYALQHVAVVGNTVADTRTGQSETVAVNGDVIDFLVADNRIDNTDNIGIDIEGWYDGTDQARYGVVADNVVANVDTWDNHAYGVWDPVTGRCGPLPPNAAGIYDDGATFLWIDDNVVANTDQGISLDTETAGRWTQDILVTANQVWDAPGTRLGDPSFGPNPPGIPGHSQVAGHAYDAFYVDAFGSGTRIADVYAYDNGFVNESRYFGGNRPQHATVVDFGGDWSHVVLWDNTVVGGGYQDPWVSLLGIDNRPTTPVGTALDCTRYENPGPSVNFYTPTATFTTLAAWQRGNGYGWDTDSTIGRPPACPPALP